MPALAATAVSGSTNSPISTSTAAAGSPDDVSIASGVAVTPPGGAAVTLDSNNSVANAGTIKFTDIDNATGILALGGHSGSVDNSGAIEVDETATAADTNGDGIIDGALATGSNRFGIRVTGPGALTGSVSNDAGATITVTGNNSAAISVETDLQGALSTLGAVAATGSHAYGLHTTGRVTGDLTVGGTVTATGEGAQGVALDGDVSGGLIVNGALTTTGYRTTVRPTTDALLAKLLPIDMLRGGPALSVAGNVARGVLVDTTGSVTAFGAAPAISIGGPGPIALGNVAGDPEAYGVVIRGAVLGSGVFDGVSATGLQLGSDGGATVAAGGGLHVAGSVTATAYAADATGVHVTAGAQVPLLRNDGVVSAMMLSTAASGAARGIVIEAGASVPAFVNTNTLTATVDSTQGSAVALVDRSGSLSSLDNTRTIGAIVANTSLDQVVPGRAIALDLSANTSGAHLSQYDISGGTAPPSINGEVRLGSGADRIDVLAGSITGDVALGAGANALNVDGGAKVAGRITATGGTLALDLPNGTLDIKNAQPLNLTHLTIGGGSTLVLAVDPAAGAATSLQVAGTATLASGAKIGVRLTGIQQGTETYTLIKADQLVAGAVDPGFVGAAPYLYAAQSQIDQTAGTVSLTLALKSAAQLQLPTATAAAYTPLLTALQQDAGLRDAVLAQTSRSGLIGAYNQMLPNYSGSIFQLAVAGAEAFSRPIDDLEDPEGGSLWVQQVDFGLIHKGSADLPGAKSWGLGLIGGYDLPATSLGVFGLTFGASGAQVKEDAAANGQSLTTEIAEGGAYWRAGRGPFSVNARLAGDYLRVTSHRTIDVLNGDGVNVSRSAKGIWTGYGVLARMRVSYEAQMGAFYVRPQASADYYRLSEGGYAESGGGPAFDLNVSGRSSSQLSGFAGVAAGRLFGEDRSWGPEVLLGWRQAASETLGDTKARFGPTGAPFTLTAEAPSGGGPTARLALKAEQGSGAFVLEGGAERRGQLTLYDLRAAAHIRF